MFWLICAVILIVIDVVCWTSPGRAEDELLSRRTLWFLTAILVGCGLMAVPTYWGPSFLAGISGAVVIVPFLSAHLLNKLGVPHVLEHDGACGWGLCDPSTLGWVLVAIGWLAVLWVVAWGLARLTARS